MILTTTAAYNHNRTQTTSNISSTQGPVYVENVGKVYLTHQTAVLHFFIPVGKPASITQLLDTIHEDISRAETANFTLLKSYAAHHTANEMRGHLEELVNTLRDIVPQRSRTKRFWPLIGAAQYLQYCIRCRVMVPTRTNGGPT